MNTFGEFSPEELNSEVDTIYKELEADGYTRPRYQPPVEAQPQPTATPELSATQAVEMPETPIQTPSQPDSQLMPASEDLGAADYLLDVARGVVRGGLGAVESTADLLSLGYLPNDFLTGKIDRPKSAIGGLAEGATEFAVGFIPAFRAINIAGKAGKLAKAGSIGKWLQKSQIGRGAIAGAVADFTVFDEHEERLSNLIQQFPSLENPVTEFLAADKDDGLLEGRLKNVLEGAMIGSAIDGIILGVKALKKARGLAEAGNAKGAEKALEDAGLQIQQTIDNEVTTQGLRPFSEAQVVNFDAGAKATRNEIPYGTSGYAIDLPATTTNLLKQADVADRGRVAPEQSVSAKAILQSMLDGWDDVVATTTKRWKNDVENGFKSQFAQTFKEKAERIATEGMTQESRTIEAENYYAKLGRFNKEQLDQTLNGLRQLTEQLLVIGGDSLGKTRVYRGAGGGRSFYRPSDDVIVLGGRWQGNKLFHTPVHEIVHALTSRQIDLNIPDLSKAKGSQFLAKIEEAKANPNVVQPLRDLIDSYVSSAEKLGVSDTIFGKPTKSGNRVGGTAGNRPDQTTAKGVAYGFGNLDEFMAQAISSPGFQTQLASIKLDSGKSAFRALTDAIADLLGMDIDKTMLEKVLRETAELAGTPVSRGGTKEGVGAGAARMAGDFAETDRGLIAKDRIPELQQAIRDLQEGKISREQYDSKVEALKPIRPVTEVATVTDDQAKAALKTSQVEKFGAHRNSVSNGTEVGLRIDIPAFTKTGNYVITVHSKAGSSSVGNVLGYDTAAKVTDAKFFNASEAGTTKIGTGEKRKFPVATVEGKFEKLDKLPDDLLTNWKQVGFDPERHSYFYDKSSGQPVVRASEAISVGNTVFVKNPEYAAKEGFAYAPTPGARMAEPQIPPTAQARFDEYLKIYEKNPDDLAALAKAFFDDTDRPLFNIESFDSVDSAHKSALALMKTFADTIERAKGEPRGAEVVAQDAIDFIRKHTDGSFMAQLTKDAKNSRQADARIRAYYGLAVSLQDKIGKHVDEFIKARNLLEQYPEDPALLKRYAENYLAATELQQKFGSVVFGYQTIRSNAGRSLNVFKQIKEQATLVEYAKAMMEQAGGKQDVEATLDKLHLIWKKHGGAGLAKQTPAGMLDMHNELWINFLLSGPKTFAVNALGTGLTTFLKPVTSAIGAHGRYILTGDTSYKLMRDEFISVYGYMMDSFKEAVDLGLKAFREGDSVLQRGTSPMEKGPAITGQNVNALLGAERDANPVIAGVADFFGNTVRIPSRILTGTDEFFKQINYRSFAKAKATIEGLEALGKEAEDPAKLAQWVAARLDNIVMQDGRRYTKSAVRAQAVVEATNRFGKDGLDSLEAADFINKYISDNWDPSKGALSDYAFDVSQEVTFTRRGERNPNTNKPSLQLSLERMVSNHPALRLVVPFVTTPMNILKMVGQYTYGAVVVGSPLKNIPFLMAEKLRLSRELADPDPMVRAAASGKIYMGFALSSTAVGAAVAGTITGGGPEDENEKKIKMATGWRPYSFKVGDTYISYQRLDPFATFLGLAADIYERSTALKAQDEHLLQTTMAALAVAFSKNITNKSYLAGIEQITDAFSQPERFVPRLFQNRLGSYIPSAISQATGGFGDDPYMREARGWFDAVLRRVPGASGFVDPSRNILGEKIERTGVAPGVDYVNPIVVSSNKNDAVMNEIASVQHGFTQPRVIQDGGIDFSEYKNSNGQTAYDRWLEATSEVRINGKTLRQSLERLIKSRQYQSLSAELLEDFDSPRTREIRKVISAYRAVAKEKILREFSDLNRQTDASTRVKLALRRGESVEELLSQLQQ